MNDREAHGVELYVAGIVESIPEDTCVSTMELKRCQALDCECVLLSRYCKQGWPKQNKLPPQVQEYRKYQGELSVCNDLLMRGNCIVVPTSLREKILQVLHEGHQGIKRCKARARESVWWPSLGKHIASLVSGCHLCAQSRIQRSEQLLSSSTPSIQWEEVGIDIFHLNGTDYLLIVDYLSRYPEVVSLKSTTSSNVITATKSIFACHSIPRTVRSDNGPQFVAREFKQFARVYGFDHVTSSPRYAQSNGQVERTVRTVKGLLKKSRDPYLALLVYRDTPGVSGLSPAQLLMGRRLQTTLPRSPHLLKPLWRDRKFDKNDRRAKQRQASDFNRRHGVVQLRPLTPGERVWVQDAECTATVLSPARRPRSYVVETTTGLLERNRKHLVPFDRGDIAVNENHPPLNQQQSPMARDSPEESSSAEQQAIADRPTTPLNEGCRTRYGRLIVAPKRLNL
ncbi:uncharacterized protein K02A2.6-like [Ornithodoros turicata]|uniref:uncharacterized protein K02A2.6-like n=1 Tax=Ornithodoros turicata TaxID=34597 RepID=UPI00313A0115